MRWASIYWPWNRGEFLKFCSLRTRITSRQSRNNNLLKHNSRGKFIRKCVMKWDRKHLRHTHTLIHSYTVLLKNNISSCLRFQVLTAATVSIVVLWYVTPVKRHGVIILRDHSLPYFFFFFLDVTASRCLLFSKSQLRVIPVPCF
jgi:hypothetical protein